MILAAIGCMDSSGGAGINQDIRVASLMGFQLKNCVAALSLQDVYGLKSIYPIDLSVFQTHLDHILEHPDLKYLKIGALGNVVQMEILQEALTRRHRFKVILDPVLKASRGMHFVSKDGIPMLRALAGLADYICPNWNELAELSGSRIDTFEDALRAGEAWFETHGNSVLLKGGHAQSNQPQEAIICPEGIFIHSFEREPWRYSHGTGCALATAIMCLLAKGRAAKSAFKEASDWVRILFRQLNQDL